MLDASVVICAHNPRPKHFRRVLDALRCQTLPLEKWELILIDNASERRLETAFDLSWHPNARHVFEGKLGVTYARQRGMREMSSDLLIFVDDDNVLHKNYLSDAIKIGNEWPELGVWGAGSIVPEFEVEPPSYLKELIPYLSLRSTDGIYFSNVPTCNWAAPWGAGLCIRSNVVIAYDQFSCRAGVHIASRTGRTSLSGGEDLEIDYVACSQGLGMGVFPGLVITHLIPKERITEDYLLKVYEGTIHSDYLLAYKWRGKIPRNSRTFLGVLDLAASALVRRGLQRRMLLAQKRAARKAWNVIKTARSVTSSQIKGVPRQMVE